MSTITLPAPGDLVAGLNAVLPHAGTDETLPILCAVNLTVRDGQLMLAATDRFTLGTYRLIEVEGDAAFDVMLHRRDVADLVAFAKKADKRMPLTLEFGDRELTVSDLEGRKATYTLLDGEFVRWWAVLPERDSGKTVVGINPVNIARLAKATDPKHPEHIRMEVGLPHKPLRVEVGERFVGVIMPVRLPDATPEATPPVRFTEPDADVQKVVDDMNADPAIKGEVTGVKVVTEPEPAAEPDVVEDEQADPAWAGSGFDADLGETEFDRIEREIEEEGAEETPDWCGSCKGFGVVRGVGSKAGQPYKTANGAATATTSVECPTCHGDKVVAA